jgi:hypothetical protein
MRFLPMGPSRRPRKISASGSGERSCPLRRRQTAAQPPRGLARSAHCLLVQGLLSGQKRSAWTCEVKRRWPRSGDGRRPTGRGNQGARHVRRGRGRNPQRADSALIGGPLPADGRGGRAWGSAFTVGGASAEDRAPVTEGGRVAVAEAPLVAGPAASCASQALPRAVVAAPATTRARSASRWSATTMGWGSSGVLLGSVRLREPEGATVGESRVSEPRR